MTDFFINKRLIRPVSKVYSEITFIFVPLIRISFMSAINEYDITALDLSELAEFSSLKQL